MVAFLTSPKALAVGVALAAVIGLGPPAWAASQYVVIAAEGSVAEAFPPGKVLVPGDRIEVGDDSKLTLLGEDGTVTAIPGPAKVAVTEDSVRDDTGEAEDLAAEQERNRSTLEKLASLIAGEQRRADSLGVSRGFDAAGRAEGLDDPWVLSVHRTAQGCVRNEPIRLGRRSAAKAITLTVRGDDIDSVTEIEWPAGESVIDLPEKLGPTNAELLVKADGSTVFITLNRLPDDVRVHDPMAVMGWMVDQGCDGQAIAFARLLAAEAQR